MRRNRSLILIISGFLLIELIMFTRISNMNSQIQQLTYLGNNLQSGLRDISVNVNNTLDRFIREQNWITPVDVNTEKTKREKEKGSVILNWQIKDLPQGASVVFHYRESEAGEFAAIPAEEIHTGFFQVRMPITKKAEPRWDVHLTRIDRGGSRTAETAAIAFRAEQPISYYVSLEGQGTIKNSEISYFDIAYLTQTKYEPIRGHIEIKENKYLISLVGPSAGGNTFAAVKAEFYTGNDLVAAKTLTAEENKQGIKTYALVYDAGTQKVTSLVIQVEYTNGDVFQKEIH